MHKDLTENEITRIVDSFLGQNLPKEDWTHQAHIVMSFWFNWQYEFLDAFDKMKEGIVLYNESVGTINSDTSGYHETLTRFWMILIHNVLADQNYETLSEAILKFMNLPESRKDSPMKYYTKTYLFTIEARHQYLEGDLKSIFLSVPK